MGNSTVPVTHFRTDHLHNDRFHAPHLRIKPETKQPKEDLEELLTAFSAQLSRISSHFLKLTTDG
jgi:hypothetical protein